jgi:hypothetical protein
LERTYQPLLFSSEILVEAVTAYNADRIGGIANAGAGIKVVLCS